MFFLERTFDSLALPVDPALFLSPQHRCEHRLLRRHAPDKPIRLSGKSRSPRSGSCIQRPTPQTRHLGHFGPFQRSEAAPNSGQTNPSPDASTGGRSGQSGTLMGATGGTQTHSRRTGSKLGQLHCTRQALVRVPESNTKYGGKARKTGVAPSDLCRQVSVSPQGFPSEKNSFHGANLGFVPLFTGQVFIVLSGLLWRDSG